MSEILNSFTVHGLWLRLYFRLVGRTTSPLPAFHQPIALGSQRRAKNSISITQILLFRLYISSCIHFGNTIFKEFIYFIYIVEIVGTELFIVFSYYSSNVYRINGARPSFILNFGIFKVILNYVSCTTGYMCVLSRFSHVQFFGTL